MYVDSSLLLCDGQDTYETAAVSDSYVDLGVAGRDVGPGEQLYVICTVGTSLTSEAEDSTLTISLQTAAIVVVNAFTSPTVLLSTRAYAESTLTAGRAPIVIPIPLGTAERYLQLLFTVSGSGSFTAGALDAFIGIGAQTNV